MSRVSFICLQRATQIIAFRLHNWKQSPASSAQPGGDTAHRDLCISTPSQTTKTFLGSTLMDTSITSSASLKGTRAQNCFGPVFKRQCCLLQSLHKYMSSPQNHKTGLKTARLKPARKEERDPQGASRSGFSLQWKWLASYFLTKTSELWSKLLYLHIFTDRGHIWMGPFC